MTVTLADLCVSPPAPGPRDWNESGVVVLEQLIPDELIARYCTRWLIENVMKRDEPRWGGFPTCTPYMEHFEIRDILCFYPLVHRIQELIGEPAGVHLNLTGWVTTTRDWHQDQYLNEPGVDDAYAAVWIALDDIDPASGPFQYVAGSHRWPQVDRERLLVMMHPSEQGPDWPRYSERILTPLFEAEIAARDAEVVTYLPRKGDVLIWHPRLLHRGSKPRVQGMERRALIAHYSGVSRSQLDMPKVEWHGGHRGGYFFVLEGGPV